MRSTLIIMTVLLGFKAISQGDSLMYSRDFLLNEGLYLTYLDFRHNWPISKEKINSDIKKEQLDFYSKLIEYEKINYVERNGKNDIVKSENVWGYCQNNVIYVNLKKSFFRVTTFGAISYFPATVDINFYSPGVGMFIGAPVQTGGTTNTKELREFLMDFYTGHLFDFSTDQILELMKNDSLIYNEYAALSKKKKRELASKYIRMYNEKHPVYFPKN